MSGSKRAALRAMALILCGLALGSVAARWPVTGEEWAEWTRYDAGGNAIGGGRIECDGSIRTWGEAGSPSGLTLYRCH